MSLREFLEKRYLEDRKNQESDSYGYSIYYKSDIEEDALSGDWLENRTSYVWKVGIAAFVDANKCDWVYVYIGHQRSDSSTPQFIGCLYWENGENDDIPRSVDRYLKIMKKIPVFWD